MQNQAAGGARLSVLCQQSEEVRVLDATSYAVIKTISMGRVPRGPAGEGGQLQQYVNDRPYVANNDQSCSCMVLGIVCAS